MSEVSTCDMVESGAASVVVIDQSSTPAQELADKLGRQRRQRWPTAGNACCEQ